MTVERVAVDEQKRENNLEGSSFVGFDSRFLRKCHQKTVKSRILVGNQIKGLRPLPPTPGHWRVMPASVYIQHHILSSHIFWASWQLKECINTCQ